MADQWDDIEVWFEDKAEKQLQASVVAVSTMVTQKTPVRDGYLKASWNWGVGAPDPTLHDAGRDAIAYLRGQIKSFNVGSVGYFTNAQPYAWKMELGGSEQATQGMVRISIANWQEINDKIARS